MSNDYATVEALMEICADNERLSAERDAAIRERDEARTEVTRLRDEVKNGN